MRCAETRPSRAHRVPGASRAVGRGGHRALAGIPVAMNRAEMLGRLRERNTWDLLIIGGGATGMGCAVDAASRGYRTALIEQYDFGKGTSSRSTKLVHGDRKSVVEGKSVDLGGR